MRVGIMRILALSMISSALAGCAAEKQATTPADTSISYRVGNGELANTDRRASVYCTHIGLHSQLRSISGEPGQRVAIYDCM